MKKLLRAALAALMATAGAVVFAPPAAADVDIYITPGYHSVNGREWVTTCEPYSVTHRCTTKIWATQVTYENGRFTQKQGWYFNNLTYRAAPRSVWVNNPLAAMKTDGAPVHYSWTATDGREWKTECDTSLTGRGGCRSFTKADVIAKKGAGYEWQRGVWTFNSMVRFGDVQPLPEAELPIGDDLFEMDYVHIAQGDAPARIGSMTAYYEDGILVYSANPAVEAGVGVVAMGNLGIGVDFWALMFEEPTWPNPKAVCGILPDTDMYGCMFTTPKYGSVMAAAFNAPNADVHAVVNSLVTSMR